MNYETATDRELNGRLLELIHGEVVNYWCLSDDETYIYDCGPAGDAFHKIDLLDYCADISATWPLMIEYGVELSPCFNGWWFAGVVDSYTYEEEVLSYSGITTCENPLRAIVICLIKVLEANNA